MKKYIARKRILFLNRSFWPDIEATGQFLTELCERLSVKYKVTVIAGRSFHRQKEAFRPLSLYSREVHNGVHIIRVRHTRFWKGNLAGRFANWVSYGILSFMASFMVRADMVVACTDPPFLGIMAMIIKWLRFTPYIYNCRDLYPDVVLTMGILKEGLASGTFDRLNKKAFLSAQLVVPLGESMKKRIEAKNVPSNRLKIIPDWVDTSIIKPVSKEENPLLVRYELKDKFVVVYSGNIGLSQDFSYILNACKNIQDKVSFQFVFIGGGAGKDKLESQISRLGVKNTVFLPYQSFDMLSFSLSMADIHLIPLNKGMAGTVVPCKVYGIMAAGRPYLTIADADSEPAVIAREFGCGLWAGPEDIGAITREMIWAIQHPAELLEMGQAGRRVAESKFDKNIIIDEWFGILQDLS